MTIATRYAAGASSRRPVAHVVEHGYGTAIGEIFLVAAPLGLLVVALMLSLPAKPLGRRSGIEQARGAAPA